MPQPKDVLWRSEPRVLIKHQVYRHYLQCWMAKICQRFGSATIVDAFAGPGKYIDGPDGSPIVIAKTFLDHKSNSRFNQLKLVCLEKRQDRRAHLLDQLEALPRVPKLIYHVMDAGEAAENFAALDRVAHAGLGVVPTLWVLDPFDLAGAPFELVEACLQRPHDEVLVTWFADEIYRFCEDPSKSEAMDRHFGGRHWESALALRGESRRKEALLRCYETGLQSVPEVRTNSISISSKNETARYSLVFATHSDAGLQCFNPVGWRLDPVRGKMINEYRGMNQVDLFADSPLVENLADDLRGRAGTAVPFAELRSAAQRMGYLDKHLRETLDGLAADGEAVREYPLESRTRWPDDSVVRFYS